MEGLSSSRAAASHALKRCAILVAASCACCMSMLHGVRCSVWCMLQLVLGTVHGCFMLHGVRTSCLRGACCILVLHVAFCMLKSKCLRGRWDSPCCTGMACVCTFIFMQDCMFCAVVHVLFNVACFMQIFGGVLSMSGGSATFESVAISDPSSASVRVAEESGRRRMRRWCAGWWRGVHGRRVCRIQGRQHRQLLRLFYCARSLLLTVGCAGCMKLHGVRCMECAAHCNLRKAWCMHVVHVA